MHKVNHDQFLSPKTILCLNFIHLMKDAIYNVFMYIFVFQYKCPLYRITEDIALRNHSNIGFKQFKKTILTGILIKCVVVQVFFALHKPQTTKKVFDSKAFSKTFFFATYQKKHFQLREVLSNEKKDKYIYGNVYFP